MNRSALAVVAVTFGAFVPAASAHAHPHAYWRTYPVASSLCARVAAGHAPKRLVADSGQITTACQTLSNSYQQAVSQYVATVHPIAAEVRSTLASLSAAWQSARQTHDWKAFRAAVKQARSTFRGYRAQERSAAKTYVATIRAARHTFWTTIHALRGAGSLRGDGGNPSPPSAPTVPPVTA